MLFMTGFVVQGHISVVVFIHSFIQPIHSTKSFDIFTLWNLQNIFMEYDLYLIS